MAIRPKSDRWGYRPTDQFVKDTTEEMVDKTDFGRQTGRYSYLCGRQGGDKN